MVGAADSAFSPNTAVTLATAATGTANLTATLDTGAFNQTIGGLMASPNTAGSAAAINVGTGKTLTINGAITFGSNLAPTDVSNITGTGGGTLSQSAQAAPS